MKMSSATPRSRATNVSSGSVEPPSTATRHDLRQSSNCAGDASATVATRFLTGLKAIQVQVEQFEPSKVAENRRKDKFKAAVILLLLIVILSLQKTLRMTIKTRMRMSYSF